MARSERRERWIGDGEGQVGPLAVPRPAAPRAVPRRAAPQPAAVTPTVWWARLPHCGTRPPEQSLVAVNSDRFADGSEVDLPAAEVRGRRPAGWLVEVRYRMATGDVVAIDVAERVADPGAPLWFAEVHHVFRAMPSVSLYAFAGRAFPPGALVRPHEAAQRGVRMQERIAEVRWWTRSGLVETVQVQPRARGRGMGRLVVVAAEGLRAVRGWAPLLADGQLTDAAADWLAGSPPCWQQRLAGRTQYLPPQDDDAPTGVARLLADLPTALPGGR